MGVAAGSYCQVIVHAENADAMEIEEDKSDAPSSIAKRTEVKIVKI